tara:strand:- start:366 stop:665 length:300 start_codon:yes stop_codon:yes gene_type:complete
VKNIRNKLDKMLIHLRKSFDDVDEEIKNVGKKYYVYDRRDWLKKDYNKNDKDIEDTDFESLRTDMIQMVLFGQQIFVNKEDKVMDRKKINRELNDDFRT